MLFRSSCISVVCLALVMSAPALAGVITVSNPGSISIPDSGAANPYPATINVSGVEGLITGVTVSLYGISHTFPDDLEILLLSPGGQTALLMSNAGASNNLEGFNLTFDDAAAPNYMPDAGVITSGTYAPSNYGSTGFAPPAPAGPYGGTLSALNGYSANGLWRLFVYDDVSGDSGTISGGWGMTITTDAASAVPEPSTAYLLLGGAAALLLTIRRRLV
jgi:subtilisin-like proprotein convertase family protein